MFGRRSDARMVKDLPKIRAFMPFISPRRNDSLVYYTHQIEADAALAFVDEYNRTAPADKQMTLFHLVLRAHALAFQERPGVNRFVAGGRLWQRDEMWITFSAKREMADRSPLITVKRLFPAGESLDEMVTDILGRLRRRRGGQKTQSDREMSLALRMPPFVIRAAVWLLHQANQLGLLPKKMIDDDPLFATLFLANLGSVGLESGYHHLWEYGTCSAFGVMGLLKPNFSGKTIFEMRYSYDERMEDGFYAGVALQMIREYIENPEKLR